MKGRKLFIILILILVAFLFNSFVEDNPYFHIDKKDCRLIIPKGFPKPYYDLKKNKITPAGFLLGRKLFHDPILSLDSSTSCSSCHQRFAAFAHIDHKLSHGINGLIGKRNVPAIQNMIWQNSFMWDGGINHLDLQPIAPITSAVEMNEQLSNVISKLQHKEEYVASFRNAFGDTAISSEKMLKAISQFIALMISSDSRYDKYMAGKEKFSEQESAGLKTFRARCASCHREPLFTDNSFRNIGLFPDTALNDSGREAITGKAEDFFKFKVPSLRNVEMTYPYMHDGRFKNLALVLNHYSQGKFYSAYTDSSIVALKGLTTEEKDNLMAFLKTLTDKTFLYDRRFIDPNLK